MKRLAQGGWSYMLRVPFLVICMKPRSLWYRIGIGFALRPFDNQDVRPHRTVYYMRINNHRNTAQGCFPGQSGLFAVSTSFSSRLPTTLCQWARLFVEVQLRLILELLNGGVDIRGAVPIRLKHWTQDFMDKFVVHEQRRGNFPIGKDIFFCLIVERIGPF